MSPGLPEWAKETISIILVLGGLECILWMIDRRGIIADRKELRDQTILLEDICVTLSIRENGDEEDGESTVDNSAT